MKKMILFFILLILQTPFAEEVNALKTPSEEIKENPSAQISPEEPPRDSLEENAINPLARELAEKDSLLSLRDSLYLSEEARLKKEITLSEARCENWEKSFNTVQEELNSCAKVLRVTYETQEANAKDSRRNLLIAQTGSFIGGILVGLLLYWAAFD